MLCFILLYNVYFFICKLINIWNFHFFCRSFSPEKGFFRLKVQIIARLMKLWKLASVTILSNSGFKHYSSDTLDKPKLNVYYLSELKARKIEACSSWNKNWNKWKKKVLSNSEKFEARPSNLIRTVRLHIFRCGN